MHILSGREGEAISKMNLNSTKRRFGIRSEPNSVFVEEDSWSSISPSTPMPSNNVDSQHFRQSCSSSSSSAASAQSKNDLMSANSITKCSVAVKQCQVGIFGDFVKIWRFIERVGKIIVC